MKVVITCNLAKPIDRLTANQIGDLADFFNEFFDGNCETFIVERIKEEEDK